MNQDHSNPYFNPSFTFLPQNPNPNFPYSFPPNPEPPPPPLPPPPPTSSSATTSLPNLSTTLSTLKQLISLAETTLTSVTNLLTLTNHTDFLPCPFDSRHRMPPESLFKHSLQCPSSPGTIDLEILNSLNYPDSLKSEHQLQKENPFVQSLGDSDSDTELCFSIDGYGDFGSNFFYKDCPGVYCSTELDSSKRFFTLPSVLSVHCANFVHSRESKLLLKNCLGILPSDVLNVRREVEAWNSYPYSYSLLVLRVVLGFGKIEQSKVLKWIISNSPRYGVIIDAAMRDHIFLLLKLCLKAISVEAHHSNELLMKEDVKEKNGGSDIRSFSFNCPVLVEAMSWLASQLSVLYGEPNGKFLSINLLKHCILNAASSLSAFPMEKKCAETSASKEDIGQLDGTLAEMSRESSKDKVIGNVKIEEPTEECEKGNLSNVANCSDGLVFVSQIAAAIAALRERSLLEEKIKGLRIAGSLSKIQRLTEYSNVTMRAEEERRKRSNYRPILDHDGLLWHRSHSQDSNKNKTREELLAEERDYKRRRMSYRGKKAKRSVTEVMRDIIEEHMEEIKQAGGIGCFVKGSAESAVFPPGPVSIDDAKVDNEFRKNVYDSPEPSSEKSHGYRKQIQQPERRAPHGHQEHLDNHQKSRYEKRDREYRSRSPEEYRSHGRSHEKHRHRREHDEMERARSKYDKYDSASPHRARTRDSRSSSYVSSTSTDFSEKKYDRRSDSKDYHKGRTHRSRRSESVTQTIFEDRYDPSESDSKPPDNYDTESFSIKYDRKDKLYSLDNDKKYSELQGMGNTEKQRHYTHQKS